jgi:DNA polymerase-3 subunit beta
MKFLCSQSDLTKALNIVSRAVTSRTTIPILKGILLEAKNDGNLYLSASDLDISIETQIEASVSDEGSIVLTSKLFADIVRKLPQGEVSFEEKEEGVIDIKCVKSEFRIMGISADEFPRIHGEMKGIGITLEKNKLKEMIRKTCFAASADETRGIITGVLIELKKSSVNMVALDGFRMAIVREQADNEEEKSIIIPAGIMNEVGKIMSEAEEKKHSAEQAEEDIKNKEEDTFDVITDDKKIMFKLKNTTVVSRLLEGVFVKYEDIIPKEYKTSVVLNREELRESAERASVLIKEGKNNFIKMSFSDGQMVMTSRNEEGAFRDEIMTDQSGNDIEIGFNARFVLDTLKVISDEDIRMNFNTPVTPCLIRPTEGNSYEYLVLPVRLAGS